MTVCLFFTKNGFLSHIQIDFPGFSLFLAAVDEGGRLPAVITKIPCLDK